MKYFQQTSLTVNGAVHASALCNRVRLAVLALFTFLCFLSLVWAVQPVRISYAEQPTVKEYELKAVYLYNFLQFVQWPDDKRGSSKDEDMIIGIIGESPFGNSLEDLRREIRQQHMTTVKFVYYGPYEDVIRESRDISSCHLLFLCSSEKGRFAKIIADLNDAPVLTVADTDNFLSSGGMIALVQSKGKIRWMINRTAVDKAGLRFSAQLLSMAVKVEGGN
jgi:hypothetical protein